MASVWPPDDVREREDWFFMWVGLCLTRWGYVNEELYRLCRIALGTTPRNAAIVFYKTPSFDARMTLTDELLCAAFPTQDGKPKHTLIRQWEKIREKLLDLSPVRNVLAHQNPTQTGDSIELLVEDDGTVAEPVIIEDKDNWFEMRLSQSEALRRKKPKVDKVRDDELPDHFAELKTVLLRLEEFRRALSEELRKVRAAQATPRALDS